LASWVLAAVASPLVIDAARAAPAPRTAIQEYDLKAAFLLNFANFVEWPAHAFPAADTPITIGVLGEDPFGSSLDEIVAGETVRGRRLVVRRYPSVDRVETCHILFVGASEARRLDAILEALGQRSILTVGETKDFTSRAGIIGFEVVQRRLRLRINLGAATAAQLVISSKLLRLAEVVNAGGGRK